MVFKVAVSNRFQFKAVPSFRTMLFPKEGEIHYIGGADILPAPLDSREEARLIGLLGTEQEKEAKAALIEHNLRLVVYIAKKFDNTSVGVEDLISIGTIGYEDCFYGEGVCLIEWSALIQEILPEDAIHITIEKDLEKGFDYRRIQMEREKA